MNNVAILDDAQIKMMEQYASQYSASVEPDLKISQLKLINDQLDPMFGQWFVDRKKENGVFVNEGKRVVAMTILDAYQMYNYYTSRPGEKNCYSQLFYGDDRDKAWGNEMKIPCNTCPRREKGAAVKCKCQNVIYCIAHCEDGSNVGAVSYIGGSSFMNVVKYLGATKLYQGADGRLHSSPIFAFKCMLGAEKATMGNVTFNIAVFDRGEFNPDFDGLAREAKAIKDMVAAKNRKHGEQLNLANPVPERKPVQPVRRDYVPTVDQQNSNVVGQDVVSPLYQQPVDHGFPASSTGVDDCPFDNAPTPEVVPQHVGGAGAQPMSANDMDALFANAGI